jgi:hypothetical protein
VHDAGDEGVEGWVEPEQHAGRAAELEGAEGSLVVLLLESHTLHGSLIGTNFDCHFCCAQHHTLDLP